MIIHKGLSVSGNLFRLPNLETLLPRFQISCRANINKLYNTSYPTSIDHRDSRTAFVRSILCEMRLLLFVSLFCLALAGSETQKPLLQGHEHHSASPLDRSFDRKVEWALKHFNIPGLAVAVTHGETFSKVSKGAAFQCLD